MSPSVDERLASIVRALTDVVLPSLPPEAGLAQEQIQLCRGLLDLLSRQLPLQFRFDCDELARLRSMGEELLPLADPHSTDAAARQALTDALKVSDDVLRRAKADPSEVVSSVRALRAATGELVKQACATGQRSDTARLENLVLEHSRDQLLRDRTWLLPQGWERDPAKFPPIDTLIPSV